MRIFCSSLVLIILSFICQPGLGVAEDSRTKVGIIVPLTKDGAVLGVDMKNAIVLANELLANNAYELIVEDEQGNANVAVSAFQKLVSYDGVHSVLGLAMNASLLAVAPLAEKKDVLVIASCATTGDEHGYGNKIYRTFQADQHTVPPLFALMKRDGKRYAILSEDDAYPELITRTLTKINTDAGSPLELLNESVAMNATDYRSVLLRIREKKIDGILFNAGSEEAFIRELRQFRQLQMKGNAYAIYFPPSPPVQKELGSMLNGVRYVNMRSNAELGTSSAAKDFLEKYKARFGEPQSGLPVALTSAEAFRIFHAAMQSGKAPEEYLHKRHFTAEESLIGEYQFDDDGAATGMNYVTREITPEGEKDIR